MSVSARYVLVLDGSGADSALVGGKGAALDRLVAWGQRVPPTAVVTAEAFRVVVEQPALASLMARCSQGEPASVEEVDAAFLGAGLPAEVLDEVMKCARRVAPDGRLAMRSSATVEDMAQSSFAGQYRSLLGVPADEPAAIERAVLEVFASLFHPAPRAYRDALGVSSSGIAMAVVMMSMVDSVRSGVVFTLDPTVIDPTVRVEVVDGLGESLVSGRRTPTVHQFSRAGVAGATSVEPLPDGELRAVVEAALEIERRAGVPQDIEWAWDESTLWIVQARPVTAHRSDGRDRLDTDPFDDDPAGLDGVEFTTEGIGEMLPDVLAPLVWQTASLVVEEGFRTMLDRLGGDLTGAVDHPWLLRRIGGRAALDVARLSAAMSPIPGAAERLRSAYFGEPEVGIAAVAAPGAVAGRGARLRRQVLVGAHLRQAGSARRRATFDAEVLLRAVSAMEQPDDLSTATVAQLLARRLELVALSTRAMAAELTVSADAGAIHAAVRSVLGRYLPPDEAARWADRSTVPPPLPPAAPRGSAAVFAGPTWDELGLDPIRPSSDRSSGTEVGELETRLESSPRWPGPGLRRRLVRRRVEHLVERARHQFARREATKAALLVLGGDVRRIHLELGRRLVDRSRLVDQVDVDLLTVAEIRELFSEAGQPDRLGGPTLPELDRRRRIVQRHRAGPVLPSRWQGLPPKESPAAVGTVGGMLTGWAVSGGRFVGRARRVTGPEGPIGRDEVLLAAATDPSWSPVLLRCGAMVLERGGPLSHAAILAREFGLPAVCNLPGAVAALDGRMVLVDGDAGTVTVLDEPGVVAGGRSVAAQ